MYLPETFRLDDRAALLAHAAAHPFATLITAGITAGRPAEPSKPGVLHPGDVPDPGDGHDPDDTVTVEVSHVPLLVDAERGVLRGHLARENPQLAHLAAGARALAVFHGPHGYVSPSVYTQHPSVPTWNYVVVHARGRARVVDEASLRRILDDTVARFDTTGWRFDGGGDAEYVARMVGAIAGFEIAIDGLEGKWKLSQNRPPEDQDRVIDWLERGDDASRGVAALMRARREGPGRC